MTSRCKQQMRAFVKSYPHIFDGLNSLVDVGGNIGTAVKIIAEAFPLLRCTTTTEFLFGAGLFWVVAPVNGPVLIHPLQEIMTFGHRL